MNSIEEKKKKTCFVFIDEIDGNEIDWFTAAPKKR